MSGLCAADGGPLREGPGPVRGGPRAVPLPAGVHSLHGGTRPRHLHLRLLQVGYHEQGR